jgi:hypothetical protein
MLNVERKCHRIKLGRIPFLPKSALWIRCTQVYHLLLRYHEGLIRNQGNLKQTAHQCSINHCFSIPLDEIKLHLKVCIQKCNYFRRHGTAYQRKHLNNCLDCAHEKDDSNKEQEILAIIQRKKDRSFWHQLNYVMDKPRNSLVRQVLVEDEEQGTLTELITQESVQEAIFDNIHQKQFSLAEAAPTCNWPLQGLFGYNAVTIKAQQILDRLYPYPPDFDQATKEICEKCARIRMMIPRDSLNTTITKYDWKWQWKGCRESTSSSELGLHFGHYIAGCDSDHVSYFHALKTTLVVKRGIFLLE